MTSNKDRELLQMEYENLRAEIEGAIQNQVRILGYGGTALSIVLSIGALRDPYIIAVVLPPMAFFFAVLWSIEQTRMMRAGEYIYAKIEGHDEIHTDLGWESWLREHTATLGTSIYVMHYYAQFLVIVTLVLAIGGGSAGLWLLEPVAPVIGGTLKRILTVVYLGFAGVLVLLLVTTVRHEIPEDPAADQSVE